MLIGSNLIGVSLNVSSNSSSSVGEPVLTRSPKGLYMLFSNNALSDHGLLLTVPNTP